MLVLSATAAAVAKPLPAAVFALAGLRFAVEGVFQLGAGASWEHAGGVIGLVVTAAAGYCVLAFELEGQQRRPVLPTLRRGRGLAAVRGGAGSQLEDIANEAGVRQTT
jgi:succinate-acetate transporter protein